MEVWSPERRIEANKKAHKGQLFVHIWRRTNIETMAGMIEVTEKDKTRIEREKACVYYMDEGNKKYPLASNL